jgi:uridine phosphorylase
MSDDRRYHIGFGPSDLGGHVPELVLLSGDPQRTEHIATGRLSNARLLSDHRGLTSYVATLSTGVDILCCTSGMGGPSTSIVLNELAQIGVRTVIRVGTTGSLQAHVPVGSVIISSAALRRQGSTLDIAPVEFPAVGDPFVTVALATAAASLGIAHHVGITASVDTFFEGQERSAMSANPHLLRRLVGMTDEYRNLGILNYEMESATVFTCASVYGMRAGCVCAVIAQRTEGENVVMEAKDEAVERTIRVAIKGAEALTAVRGRSVTLGLDGLPVIEAVPGFVVSDADVQGWRDGDQR